MKKYRSSKNLNILAKEVLKSNKKIDANKGAKIKYLIVASKKSTYLGVCIKCTDRWKSLIDYDFVIEVWDSFWKDSTTRQKKALLLHELLHIKAVVDKNGEIKWSTRKHDLEEFSIVVKKYGLWSEVHKEFLKNAGSSKQKISKLRHKKPKNSMQDI